MPILVLVRLAVHVWTSKPLIDAAESCECRSRLQMVMLSACTLSISYCIGGWQESSGAVYHECNWHNNVPVQRLCFAKLAHASGATCTTSSRAARRTWPGRFMKRSFELGKACVEAWASCVRNTSRRWLIAQHAKPLRSASCLVQPTSSSKHHTTHVPNRVLSRMSRHVERQVISPPLKTKTSLSNYITTDDHANCFRAAHCRKSVKGNTVTQLLVRRP